MRFGITFGQLNPKAWDDAAIAADELGFESVWLPEHLVLPVEMAGQLKPGEDHPPVPPTVPVYDAAAYLSYVAGRTDRVRLGTFVYLLGIRHPFVSARAFATLDVVSDGRACVGVGAGWLTTEWEAVGLDPRARGRRLDEAIDVCRLLWTETTVAHHGDCWSFPEVAFEPKPIQERLPVLVGGESERALRRVAEKGDGWLGMEHTPATAADQVRRLLERWDAAGRDGAPEVTVMGQVASDADVDAYAQAGVDRLIVVPWESSREAVAAMETFADRYLP